MTSAEQQRASAAAPWSFRCPTDLRARLNAAAAADRRTPPDMLRIILDDALPALDDAR